MIEKMSDKENRIRLVEKFKEKVRDEMKIILTRGLQEIKTFNADDLKDKKSDEYIDFKYIIDEIVCCTDFDTFLDDYDFMKARNYCEENDAIIYFISSENLEIWTQTEYRFMRNLVERFGLGVIMITDDTLEFNFTSIFESVSYHIKNK